MVHNHNAYHQASGWLGQEPILLYRLSAEQDGKKPQCIPSGFWLVGARTTYTNRKPGKPIKSISKYTEGDGPYIPVAGSWSQSGLYGGLLCPSLLMCRMAYEKRKEGRRRCP